MLDDNYFNFTAILEAVGGPEAAVSCAAECYRTGFATAELTRRSKEKFTRDQFLVFKLKGLPKYLNRLKSRY